MADTSMSEHGTSPGDAGGSVQYNADTHGIVPFVAISEFSHAMRTEEVANAQDAGTGSVRDLATIEQGVASGGLKDYGPLTIARRDALCNLTGYFSKWHDVHLDRAYHHPFMAHTGRGTASMTDLHQWLERDYSQSQAYLAYIVQLQILAEADFGGDGVLDWTLKQKGVDLRSRIIESLREAYLYAQSRLHLFQEMLLRPRYEALGPDDDIRQQLRRQFFGRLYGPREIPWYEVGIVALLRGLVVIWATETSLFRAFIHALSLKSLGQNHYVDQTSAGHFVSSPDLQNIITVYTDPEYVATIGECSTTLNETAQCIFEYVQDSHFMSSESREDNVATLVRMCERAYVCSTGLVRVTWPDVGNTSHVDKETAVDPLFFNLQDEPPQIWPIFQ